MSGGVHLRGAPDGAGDEDLPRLRGELAAVEHQIARILLHPPYDQGRLAVLDLRADRLRAGIRALEEPVRRDRLEHGAGAASGPSRR